MLSGARPTASAFAAKPAGSAWDVVVVLAASASMVIAHVAFVRHAGALWRDEASTAAMATMTPLARIGSVLRFDSSPLFHTLTLRLWSMGPWGSDDAALRAMGLVVGVSMIPALWLVARWLGANAPWLAVALLGFNPSVIRALDSLRPYGLGTLAVVVAFGLVFRLVERTGRARFLLAAGAAVIAVQCLYANALLLVGIVGAGILVAALRGRRAEAMSVAAVGVTAALSLAPYAGAIRSARSWSDLTRFDIGWRTLWSALSTALGSGSALFVPIWIGLLALAALRALTLVGRDRAESRAERERASHPAAAIRDADAALYSVAAMAVAIPALLIALRSTGVITQPWYFAPLMGLVAVALNGALGNADFGEFGIVGRWVRAALPTFAVVVAAALEWGALESDLEVRQTNMDLVAQRLATLAAKEDLVIVNPWYFGVTFQRYYRGPAPWMTIPEIEEHRIHRFDLVKRRMQSARPVSDVLASMERTLRAGHRVWVVGLSLPLKRDPIVLPPATEQGPDRADGTRHVMFLHAWERQAGSLVDAHATSAVPVEITVRDPVSIQENTALSVISGWVERKP
jgi:CBS domain-containing protein